MFKELPASQNGISSRVGLALTTVILLLAFGLGAAGLNADVIWADELASVTHMGVFDPPYSLAQVIQSIRQYSPDHVPFYFFWGALWGQIAGWSQFSLRLMSCFFGVLMIAWLYRFAADTVNRRAAIAAALLMSTSAFALLYFHDLRMYTLLMWLGIAHTWLYWRLVYGGRLTRPTWLLFAATATVLFYTHNFSAILFVGLGFHHLIFVKKSRRWLHIILGWGVAALCFLPYTPAVIVGLRFNQGHTSTPLTAPEAAELFAYLMVNGFIWLWLPILLTFGYALRARRQPAVRRLLAVTLLMITVILLINWRFNVITITRLRYFLIVWFAVVILFAFSLTAIPYWRIISGVFLLFWCLAGWQFHLSGEVIEYAGLMARDRHYPPLHEYVFHLLNKTESQDYLVGFSEEDQVSIVSSYRSHSTADYYLKAQLGIDGIFLHASLKRYRLEQDTRGILREHPHLLLAHDPSDVPPNYARALEIIQENYMPCAVLVDKSDLLVQRYVHSVMDCDHEPAPIAYENGIKVIDRAARYVPASNLVQVLTWWEVADESLLDKYNVSMQIITPDWQNVRQEDRHLYELPPWDVIELSTADLPPGDYRLVIILYHRDSGEKVSGVDPATGETAKIWPILEFTIESGE